MNSVEQASHPEHPSAEVVVEVEGCRTADAHAVFSALRTAFRSDRAPDDVPQEMAGPGTTVWTSTVDVSERGTEPEPRRLTAPVTVSLQGGYWAVDQLCAGLRPAFAVTVLGTAAGDQEKEVELRLETLRRLVTRGA
ncbi:MULTISPECIES: hypothetical protein [Streptomyces]|uniref:hypothetical protein n=1 Tax=Streptomyces TaxID=1883 RepID=UPI0019646FBD|nr:MULTISPECIES: hypothetical protein [Streptomyces]QRX94897.1 hypothetical protein JNO44_32290 [Streptomyces noursei]UJB44604.1 hypothetical protein HRD51_30805 [Streptomyces sp. A1-5]